MDIDEGDVEIITTTDSAPSETAKHNAETAAADIKKQQEQAAQAAFEKGKPIDSSFGFVPKIKIKLDRLGSIITNTEHWVYTHYHIERELLSQAEIDQEIEETKEDITVMIDNRVKILSIYGDILNVLIDIGAHVSNRAVRVRYRNDEMRKQQGNNQFTQQSEFADNGINNPDGTLTPEAFRRFTGHY